MNFIFKIAGSEGFLSVLPYPVLLFDEEERRTFFRKFSNFLGGEQNLERKK